MFKKKEILPFHCDMCNGEYGKDMVSALHFLLGTLPACIIMLDSKRAVRICQRCQVIIGINPPQGTIWMREADLKDMLEKAKPSQADLKDMLPKRLQKEIVE